MKIINVKKKTGRIGSTIRSVSRAAKPIGSEKYAATGTVKLLRKTEREKECDELIELRSLLCKKVRC